MKNLVLVALFALFSLVLIPMLKGQNSEKNTQSDSTLQELVVTAQRSASDAFITPEAITVLQNGFLGRTLPRSTPEALQGTAGVFVQKTNHGGGSPFVRGLTGNQTLILIDGVRLNNATFRFGPNQYLNTIDPLSIERVEVLRGSGGVAYGSDAMGGTIQIFNKNPVFSEETSGMAAFLAKFGQIT
ncbi:MAG: Plug domain-containing protein [Saprospiraceae bacterium]|nr:Plug domain-containing protein [Saprospiraceae bacterium]